MAYLEGRNLAQRIADGPFDLSEALDIVIQVAQGLEEAHENDIVHRDIKSANIMLTNKGQAVIMDFGLAYLAGGSRITRNELTLGTTAYMSPEQTAGEALDRRTDLWSLGVVLYEMLTGRLPFRGHYADAIVYSIANIWDQALARIFHQLTVEAHDRSAITTLRLLTVLFKYACAR